MSSTGSFLRPLLDLVRERGESDRLVAAGSAGLLSVLGEARSLALCEWLCDLLRSVIQRRGLAASPGALLGHPGYATLLPSSDSEDCALHDLTQDLVEEMFVGSRLRALLRGCEDPDWDPDLMARRITKNFVHDLQRRGDPIGAAIYDGLQRATSLEEARGWAQWCDDHILLARQHEELTLVRDREPECAEIEAAFGRAGSLEELGAKVLRYYGGGEEREGTVARVHLRSRKIDQQLLGGLAELRGSDEVVLPISRLVEVLRGGLPDGRPSQVGGESEYLLESLPGRGEPAEPREASTLSERVDAAILAANLRPRVVERLLLINRAMYQAIEDGKDPLDAVRMLGIPKQTLSDSMARLRELTQRELQDDGPSGFAS